MSSTQGKTAYKIGLLITALWSASLICLALAAFFAGWKGEVSILTALLVVLAVAGESVRVYFKRAGVVFSLGLPFVMALGHHHGWFAAAILEVLLALASSAFASIKGSQRRVWFWARFNVALSAIAASIGALLASRVSVVSSETELASAVVFGATFLVMNLLLVVWTNSTIGASAMFSSLRRSWLDFGTGAVVLLLVGLGAVSCLQLGFGGGCALLFVPLLLFRLIVARRYAAEELAYETMVALMIMLRRAHPYTHGHLERVARVAEEVGLHLGLSRARSRMLREAAILHDIGKLAVDEAVLDKPGKLTDEEYEHVKLHSNFGAVILQSSSSFAHMAPWVLHHHERMDGRGYPHQLTDREIPIESKIIAVADAFDAMTGDESNSEKRSYRDSLSASDALSELRRCAGTQFDPAVVEAFAYVLERQYGVKVA